MIPVPIGPSRSECQAWCFLLHTILRSRAKLKMCGTLYTKINYTTYIRVPSTHAMLAVRWPLDRGNYPVLRCRSGRSAVQHRHSSVCVQLGFLSVYYVSRTSRKRQSEPEQSPPPIQRCTTGYTMTPGQPRHQASGIRGAPCGLHPPSPELPRRRQVVGDSAHRSLRE
ncbi:hypothetical protein F5Y03DRAFT_47741 [Xylaria venustula]|nr:hypothetical protein F5Y03DRAFT_47741 [Xylaria venustula]